jgi:FtsP/CotA-like multicopper oxidase with cupredoxin domain
LMSILLPRALSRRRLLMAGSAAVTAPLFGTNRAVAGNSQGTVTLTPAPGLAPIMGAGQAETPVLAYNGLVSGPVLRLRQRELFQANIINGLNESTTVHWHGIRLPNGMDGVPGLTQASIEPGDSFPYAFTPPDAGTFWYHPHDHTASQMGRGMAGALIIEEPEPPGFDRDVLWVLQDWELLSDNQIVDGFDNEMEGMMAGRIGTTVTINGTIPTPVPLRAGERIRFRLINACLARFMALRFAGHRVVVMALDGQPVVQPFEPDGGLAVIAPAQRVDLLLEATGEPGTTYPVTDEFYGDDGSYNLVDLTYSGAPKLVTSSRPIILPPNPIPKPDLKDPVRHHLTIVGGGMSGMGMGMRDMMGGMGMMADGNTSAPQIWGIKGPNGLNNGMMSIFTIPLGRTVVITLENTTKWWHPMHLHGYSFQVLSRNGAAEQYPDVRDTVILRPNDTVDIAFVADNPGDWMFHCHVVEHQDFGLMTTIRVA